MYDQKGVWSVPTGGLPSLQRVVEMSNCDLENNLEDKEGRGRVREIMIIKLNEKRT